MMYENILRVVHQKHPQRVCIRNLVTDHATNEETLMSIVQYFEEYKYPINEIDALYYKDNWWRQGDLLKIEKPSLLLSVQNKDAILGTLRHVSVAFDIILGVDLSDDRIDGEDFLKKLFDIQEFKQKNKQRYADTDLSEEYIPLRYNGDTNIWVSWNETSPHSIPYIYHKSRNRIFIFRCLGLGHHFEKIEGGGPHRLKNPDAHFLVMCFDTKDRKDIQLFRPGWGDATTSEFWESIKDENAPYGYTKPLGLEDSHRQPEAVAAGKYFSLEILSKLTFSI